MRLDGSFRLRFRVVLRFKIVEFFEALLGSIRASRSSDRSRRGCSGSRRGRRLLQRLHTVSRPLKLLVPIHFIRVEALNDPPNPHRLNWILTSGDDQIMELRQTEPPLPNLINAKPRDWRVRRFTRKFHRMKRSTGEQCVMRLQVHDEVATLIVRPNDTRHTITPLAPPLVEFEVCMFCNIQMRSHCSAKGQFLRGLFVCKLELSFGCIDLATNAADCSDLVCERFAFRASSIDALGNTVESLEPLLKLLPLSVSQVVFFFVLLQTSIDVLGVDRQRRLSIRI